MRKPTCHVRIPTCPLGRLTWCVGMLTSYVRKWLKLRDTINSPEFRFIRCIYKAILKWRCTTRRVDFTFRLRSIST